MLGGLGRSMGNSSPLQIFFFLRSRIFCSALVTEVLLGIFQTYNCRRKGQHLLERLMFSGNGILHGENVSKHVWSPKSLFIGYYRSTRNKRRGKNKVGLPRICFSGDFISVLSPLCRCSVFVSATLQNKTR